MSQSDQRVGYAAWWTRARVWLVVAGAFVSGCSAGGGEQETARGDQPIEVPTEQSLGTRLAEARFLIEHNATDDDTGYQLFVDGEPWRRLTVEGPGGGVVDIQATGALTDFGLTEGFFETNEPPADEMSLEEVLALFPEGQYVFRAESAVDGRPMRGVARLTHDIPAEPEILTPAEDATVEPTGLVISWRPVTQTLRGTPVNLVGYQVIVEKDVEGPPSQSFFHSELSVFLPPGTTRVTVPDEFLEPGTPYVMEVLALEESGNQTIGSRSFETR
jgi:hypothetical protein